MIFEEQISRKPNLYPWTEEFIEAMHTGFWTDKEFNFKSDVQQFKVNLTDQEREIVKMRVKYHLALIEPRNNFQTHTFSEKVSSNFRVILKRKKIIFYIKFIYFTTSFDLYDLPQVNYSKSK